MKKLFEDPKAEIYEIIDVICSSGEEEENYEDLEVEDFPDEVIGW